MCGKSDLLLSYLLSILLGRLLTVLESTMCWRTVRAISLVLLVGLLVVLLVVITRLTPLLLRCAVSTLLGVRA